MLFEIVCSDYTQTLGGIRDVDLVLTSPPYMNARTYDIGCTFDFLDYQKLGDAIYQVLKPGGTCIMVLDAPVRNWREGKGSERGLMPWRVMLDWADRIGFRVPDRLAYGRLGLPGVYSGRFRNDWEPCFWFEKPGAKAYFDKTCMDTPSGRHNTPKLITSRRPDGTVGKRVSSGRAVTEGVKRQGTHLWYGNVGANHDLPELYMSGHPARFCSKFAADMIQCFCPPEGLVVDPFVGSGTTALMAIKHGRRFFGGDIQQQWVDRASNICKAWLDSILYPF